MIVYNVEAEVRAYSPYDKLDEDYHQKHGRSLTSRGNDSSRPGIASTLAKGVKCIVPGYCHDNFILCDDTGSMLKKRNRGALLYIEVRMESEQAALDWGIKKLRITIAYP